MEKQNRNVRYKSQGVYRETVDHRTALRHLLKVLPQVWLTKIDYIGLYVRNQGHLLHRDRFVYGLKVVDLIQGRSPVEEDKPLGVEPWVVSARLLPPV